MIGITNITPNTTVNLLSRVCNFQTKVVENKQWILIFHHHITAGYFTNAQQALFSYQHQKFSILGLIPVISNSSTYQFRLEYPNVNALYYNEWTQTSNPCITSDAVSNYTAIHTDWASGSGGVPFNGISLSSSGSALMDCQSAHSNWWFGIGQYAVYESGLTGPGSVTNEVKLWIRAQ